MNTCLVQSTCPQLRNLKAEEHLTIHPRGEKEMLRKTWKMWTFKGGCADRAAVLLVPCLVAPWGGCSHTALWHQTCSRHWDTYVITIKCANISTLNAGHLFHKSNIIYFNKIPKHIYALSHLGTSFKKSVTIGNQSQTSMYQFRVIT